MSTAEDSAGSAGAEEQPEGVLSSLPHTRPQRSSARRVAAREAAAGARKGGSPRAARGRSGSPGRSKANAAAARKQKSPGKPKAVRPSAARQRASQSRGASATRVEAVPRQGYASDGDRVSGPVSPPGGPEFLATAAEIVGELAKAGAAGGERLLRDALSRLPLG
jgi:hypothetical protein